MSAAEMGRLVNDYVQNTDLQARLHASNGDIERAVEVARAAGYQVDAHEAELYLANLQGAAQGELSDAQLDSVAGGKAAPTAGVANSG